MLKINENQYLPLAEKAVKSFALTAFPGFFSEDDLQDLISEVVLRMLVSGERYDSRLGSVSVWVGTIARNMVLDAARKESRRRRAYSSIAPGDRVDEDGDIVGFDPAAADETDAMVIALDTGRALRGAVTTERDRRLLNGLILGYDTSELAAMEGAETGSIYTAVCRLRRKLRSAA